MTARDMQLCESLGRFGVLTTDQIRRLHFEGVKKTTVLRRLRLLEKYSVIRRIEGLPLGRLAWAMTTSGARDLGMDLPFLRFNVSTLMHDVTVSEILLSLSGRGLATEITSGFSLKKRAFRYERDGGEINIPDAFFLMDFSGAKRPVALECELNRKSESRITETLKSYARKKNLWAVWYVVQSRQMANWLQRLWREIRYPEPTAVFLWSLVSEVVDPKNAILIHEGPRVHRLMERKAQPPPHAHPSAQGVSILEKREPAQTAGQAA